MDIIRKLKLSAFKYIPTHLILLSKVTILDSIPTAYTNGVEIFLSESDKSVNTLLHEILHILCEHIPRGNRLKVFEYNNTRFLWNIACDIVVETVLTDFGLNKIHPYQVMIEDFSLQNLCAEQIYKILLKKYKSKSINIDYSTKSIYRYGVRYDFRNVSDLTFNKNSPMKVTGQPLNILIDVINKHYSTESANILQNEVEFIKRSKVNFKKILTDYIKVLKSGYDDISFMRRTRLDYLNITNVKLPAYVKKQFQDPWIILDTSASITDTEYSYFISAIKNCKEFDNANVLLVDTIIQEHYKIKQFNNTYLNKLKQRIGKGGTEFSTAFNYLKKHKAKVTIIFTDLELNLPPRPNFKVIWCVLPECKIVPKYGKLVTILI